MIPAWWVSLQGLRGRFWAWRAGSLLRRIRRLLSAYERARARAGELGADLPLRGEPTRPGDDEPDGGGW